MPNRHHIYKDCWSPVIGEELNCKADPRKEAQTYDKHALGAYKKVEGADVLVGHVPIELSSLLLFFLAAGDKKNLLKAEVVGKRKREIGLVVPVKYKALTSDVKCATVLSEKLNEKTRAIELYIHKTIHKKVPCYLRSKKIYCYNCITFVVHCICP